MTLKRIWYESSVYRPTVNTSIIVWDEDDRREKSLDRVPPFWDWDSQWYTKWPKWAYARTGMRPVKWNIDK